MVSCITSQQGELCNIRSMINNGNSISHSGIHLNYALASRDEKLAFCTQQPQPPTCQWSELKISDTSHDRLLIRINVSKLLLSASIA